MLERINLILKSRNLNAAQFADEIGVQRSSVSHILTGRNNASLDFLLKVLQRYPEIDTDWLITGKGVMMRGASVNAINIVEPKKNEPAVTLAITASKVETGDLFKQTFDFQDNKIEELKKKEQSVPVIPNPDVLEMREEEEQKKPGERVNATTSARHVEKIVIFYSDRTFVDYKPEN